MEVLDMVRQAGVSPGRPGGGKSREAPGFLFRPFPWALSLEPCGFILLALLVGRLIFWT